VPALSLFYFKEIGLDCASSPFFCEPVIPDSIVPPFPLFAWPPANQYFTGFSILVFLFLVCFLFCLCPLVPETRFSERPPLLPPLYGFQTLARFCVLKCAWETRSPALQRNMYTFLTRFLHSAKPVSPVGSVREVTPFNARSHSSTVRLCYICMFKVAHTCA